MADEELEDMVYAAVGSPEAHQVRLFCQCMAVPVVPGFSEEKTSSVVFNRLWLDGEFDVMDHKEAQKLMSDHRKCGHEKRVHA